MSGPDEFGEFYHRLRQIKDYHKKNPNEIEEPMQMEFLRLEQERQKPTEEMQSETLVECCACSIVQARFSAVIFQRRLLQLSVINVVPISACMFTTMMTLYHMELFQ